MTLLLIFTNVSIFISIPKYSSAFWVSGQKSSDGNWYYNNGDSLWADISWASSAADANGCLVLYNNNYAWVVDGYDCTRTFYYICEYVKS